MTVRTAGSCSLSGGPDRADGTNRHRYRVPDFDWDGIRREPRHAFPNTAGSTTNTALPTGWYISETGGGARDNEQYAVDTGGSNTGDIFSYGSAASTDRALGQLRSGTLISVYRRCLHQQHWRRDRIAQITYDGEQWRFGAVRAAAPKESTSRSASTRPRLDNGTWIDVNALDFNPTVNTGTTGALDGNAAANRVAGITSTIAGLNIAAGATFWIRWIDVDATGADDGLAIDNFSITATAAVAAPGSLSIADQAVAEGNSGDTDMVFTVTRSGGSAGAVSATYTITNGTTDASDFGAGFTSTGTVTFADGATTAQIHVPIAGDTDVRVQRDILRSR